VFEAQFIFFQNQALRPVHIKIIGTSVIIDRFKHFILLKFYSLNIDYHKDCRKVNLFLQNYFFLIHFHFAQLT